jgi:hypothetical protein
MTVSDPPKYNVQPFIQSLPNDHLGPDAKGRLVRAVTGTSSDRSDLVQGCTTRGCTFSEIAPDVTHITRCFYNKYLSTSNFVFQNSSNTKYGGYYADAPSGLNVSSDAAGKTLATKVEDRF